MKTKSTKLKDARQIELDRTILHGNYYLPPELGRFLIELTQPEPDEKVLRIGFKEPTLNFPHETEFIPQNISNEMLITERQKALDHEKYDVILCAPNFGTNSSESNQPNEEMWLEWGVKHLKNGGRFAIVVPMGLLSNYSQIHIRQFLLEKSALEAIVELPPGWAIGAAIAASILYITTNNQKNRSIRMFQLSRIYELTFDAIAKEVRSIKPKALDPADGKVFSVPYSELDQSRLDIKYYDPAFKTFPPSSDYESVKLSNLVRIRSGNRFTPNDLDPNGVPFIQVKNLTATGGLQLRDTKKINLEVATINRSYCDPGDILVSIAGTIGKVTIVPVGLNVCIDTSLRQLRIRANSEVLPEYLALFLRSDIAIRQMKRMSSGSVIAVLSTPNLGNLTVYLPSIEKQRELVATYESKLQEFQDQLLTFFPSIDKIQPFSNKKEIVTTDAASLAGAQESLSSTVATKFPYPIARAYSLLVNSSNESGSDQVRRLISASESVVYYLYGILVSDYMKRISINNSEVNSLLLGSIYDFSVDKKIKYVNKVIRKSQDSEVWSMFVPEISNVEFNICSEIHNVVRNNFSHNETSGSWCRKQVKEYTPKLEKLLESLLLIKDYKLVQVTNITVRNGRPQYNMITMMGNNSLFTPQTEDLDSMLSIDTNHVILLDADFNALDLHPFYQFHAWENTGFRDHLCFAKQINQDKNTLKLESLEGSGVTEIDAGIELSGILAQLRDVDK